jgi:hypothetical protein
MTPCRDCTLTHPREATHVLRYHSRENAWWIQRVAPTSHTRLYCKWHATVRATQDNAALRRPQAAAKEEA